MAAISVILPGFPKHAGGGYKVVYQYANSLAESGHQVRIIQMRPDHLRDVTATSPGTAAIRGLLYSLGRHARPRWFKLDKRIRVTNHPRQSVEFIPASDVVVATAMETAEVASKAAELQGISGVYFIQHYELWSDDSSYVDATWRLPLRKIVIAPWLEQKASEFGESAAVVPNAIDAEAFPPGPPITDRPMQVLGLVSDLPWKRTDLLAEAMGLVAAEKSDVVLKTFGVIDRPTALPDAALHSRSPSPDQLRKLYQDSRVFVCTSDSEGFGLPPAEAMASGAAVASTDIGGVRSYADGVALFSPIGDARSLADNILRLLREPDLALKLSANGRDRIAAYSPAAAASAFEREVLRGIAGGSEA